MLRSYSENEGNQLLVK